MKAMRSIFYFLILLSTNIFALDIKLSVLVPGNTNWSLHFKKMSSEIYQKTNGRVKFKVYYGGVSGGEEDALRKIRLGSLHGAVLTGKTLGNIFSDIRVVEIPFSYFDDSNQAWKDLDHLKYYFNQGLDKKGFVSLGYFEVGMIYFATTKKVTGLNDLKKLKFWLWQGDELANQTFKELHIPTVPLEIGHVQSSLSQNLMDGVYNSLLGFLALQWHGQIKYLIDVPLTFSMGALVIDKKKWGEVSPQDQAIISKITDSYFEIMNQSIHRDNEKALAVLKDLNVEIIKFSDEDKNALKSIRKSLIKNYAGKNISERVFELQNQSTKL